MKLTLRIYLILTGIFLLAIVMFLTNTRYFQQFSHNREISVQFEELKKADIAKPNVSGSSVCLIYDGKEAYSLRLKTQIGRVLQDIRKPMTDVDARVGQPQLDGCAAVVVALTDLSLLPDPDRLSDYVEQGGRVFLSTTPEQNDAFMRLYRKFGIINVGESLDQTGIRLNDEVLLGEKDLHISDSFMTNTVMQVELDPEARVHAATSSGMPLLWSYDAGQGSVMIFNGTMLQEKINRGVIVGAISMMIPDFIYPVYNSKIMYIDDWPAPYGNSVDPDIYETYRMDRQEFFRQVWWPDMVKAAKRYQLEYTAVMIESYDNQVLPPFASPPDADPQGVISYGREIIKSGGEIGLHGYNHQALTTDAAVSASFDYEPWHNAEDMAASVKEALSYFKRIFPNYTLLSYVPPSNVLSSEGREALKQNWDQLAVISSVFAEDATGLSYVQEFEQAKDGILEMPRVTSGYDDEEFERWTAASVLTSYGFFSHFVHPDDVLDKERSQGMGWEELYRDYTAILSRLQQKYPWLEAKTSIEAALDMDHMLAANLELRQSGQSIEGEITPLKGKASFILRTRKNIVDASGCEVTKIGDGIMLVSVSHSKFTIQLSEA